MHVLSVISHPKPDAFTYAVLERFQAGAASAGHTNETADLYAEGFDPLMTARDMERFNDVAMIPELQAEQARVEQCDALCMIFPIWWFGMPAMMKGWLDRVWSAGWAYACKHDPKGSLLKPRPCTMLIPVGASAEMEAEWGCLERLDHIYRVGVMGYCGTDPINIHFLLDAAFEKGQHAAHLETAYEAGQTIF
ncbi:MAG: NAD(P)H dehydrogenase [Rhodospirillaceae bacterium]|nr:NAD(P)H dehydrogenase [Rhodospirillaceae bacterium]